jgi:hypothetical protein
VPDQSSATAVGVDALGEAVGLDEEQLLTVIVECERQVAALQARQVAALSALADARAGTLLEGFAEDEVALALTISPNAARQRVSDGQTLSHQLPDTLSALAAGALDYYRARCIVEAVSGLDDDVAVAVQARVLPGAAERTATQLRAAHDPGAVLEGHVLTRDQTCVNPVCSTPASSCDLDHTIPHPAGPTAARNLGCLCRHTPRAKQAGFELVQPEPGVFRWTTPTGRTYTRRPPALASPRPDHRHRARPPGASRINTLGWRLTHMTRSGPAVNGGGVRPAAARRGERAARRSAG